MATALERVSDDLLVARQRAVARGGVVGLGADEQGHNLMHALEAATVAEVLKNYGYKTSAFGKWHNTPADQTWLPSLTLSA